MKRVSAPFSSMWVAQQMATTGAADIGFANNVADALAQGCRTESYTIEFADRITDKYNNAF